MRGTALLPTRITRPPTSSWIRESRAAGDQELRQAIHVAPPPPPRPPPALGATLSLMGADLISLSRRANTIAPPRVLLQAHGTTVCCSMHSHSGTASSWFRRPYRRQATPPTFTHTNIPSRRVSATTSPALSTHLFTTMHPHLLACPLLSLSHIIFQTQCRHDSPIMIGTACTNLAPQ